MLSAIAMFLTLLVSSPRPQACETVGPRLDGTLVTICGGSVVSVSDRAGNVRARPF